MQIQPITTYKNPYTGTKSYPTIPNFNGRSFANLQSTNPIKAVGKATFIVGISWLISTAVNFKECSIELLRILIPEMTTTPIWYENLAKDGYVQPPLEPFETLEEAINYSINQITPYLNQDNPIEYGIYLDARTNTILSEKKGEKYKVEQSMLIPFGKSEDDFTMIGLHGHPETPTANATDTFSDTDFITFIENSNEREMFVIRKDGAYCSMKKLENYTKPTPKEMMAILKEYKHEHWYNRANLIKIIRNGETIHSFRDYQGNHRFWDKICKKFNIEYKTTFGVHNGIDCYQESYYPEPDNEIHID